ncbi:MAG: M23 family metallopeptidase [Actinomycetota bacterium]|nr:M23 family metallopeptidase [Actinomycetota bacterium]
MTPTSPRLRWSPATRLLIAAVGELCVVTLLVWLLPAVAFGDDTRFVAPLTPAAVVRGYDPPAQRWLPGHRGVDLSAAPGVAVRAAGDGRVRFAGEVAGRPVVSIRHTDDMITTYEPVRASVREGQSVRRGTVIGVVVAGHPGCPVAACLHWGARRGSGHAAVYLNPMALLGVVRVRLKPVDAALTPVGELDDARPAGAPR